MTADDAIRSWQASGALSGGRTVQETLQFVGGLEDIDDERSPLPMGVILAGNCEPRWLTRLRARFGR